MSLSPDAIGALVLVNANSARYGGGDVGNAGGVESEPISRYGQPHPVELTLPLPTAPWLRPGEA